jgi:HAD superfamily hydrolase (TIGR01490 family)
MTQPADNRELRPVAFFDFDGTLTTADTLMPFLKYVVGSPRYYMKLAVVSPVLMAYFAKMLRNDIAKQIVVRHYLAGYGIDKLFELGQRFSEEVIPTMLRPEGIERLRWHQQQQHECVLVSASFDLYLKAWSATEGFSRLICTSLEIDDHRVISGKLDGPNCHGEVKVLHIKKFLENKIYGVTYGYGDTISDLPMLEFLDNGMLLQRDQESIFWREV